MMTRRMSISAPPQAPPISALRGKDGAEETRETREQITQTHIHLLSGVWGNDEILTAKNEIEIVDDDNLSVGDDRSDQGISKGWEFEKN